MVSREYLEPKLKDKINNLKGYLDLETQDERYLARGYTPVQNQARKDVLCALNIILKHGVVHAPPALAQLIYLISSVLTRPELLKKNEGISDARTVEAFSSLLSSPALEHLLLVQGLITLSGYSEEEILENYGFFEHKIRLEKQLLELAISHQGLCDFPVIKAKFEALMQQFRVILTEKNEKQVQNSMEYLKCLFVEREDLSFNKIPQKIKHQIQQFKASKALNSLNASIVAFEESLSADDGRSNKDLRAVTEDLTDSIEHTSGRPALPEPDINGHDLKIPSDARIRDQKSINKAPQPPRQVVTHKCKLKMNSITSDDCIEILENLNELLNHKPQLKVPINHLIELVQRVGDVGEGTTGWQSLNEHQKLMKNPWEFELKHPELSPCIKKILNLYGISGKRLSEIKQKCVLIYFFSIWEKKGHWSRF